MDNRTIEEVRDNETKLIRELKRYKDIVDDLDMNEESVGKLFKHGDVVYKCLAYSGTPTITMENMETGKKTNMCVNSLLANQFKEIIEEDKKIEKINYYATNRVKNEFAVDYVENGKTKHFCLNKKQRYFADKINEIIDELKKRDNN